MLKLSYSTFDFFMACQFRFWTLGLLNLLVNTTAVPAMTSKPCTFEVHFGHGFESHLLSFLYIPGWFDLGLCSFLMRKQNRHYIGLLVHCLGLYPNLYRRCCMTLMGMVPTLFLKVLNVLNFGIFKNLENF